MLIRILALFLGILFLGLTLLRFLSGDFALWVGFFIGPLFIYYATKGNKGLLKTHWLSSYGKKIGK